MAFGELLKELRIKVGFESLGELSRSSGVSVATLSRLESNIQKPLPETLAKLAPLLRVKFDYLLVEAGYIDKSINDLTPTPKEEHLTFYRKVGQLSPESLAILEQQADHLLELEKKIIERKKAEHENKDK